MERRLLWFLWLMGWHCCVGRSSCVPRT